MVQAEIARRKQLGRNYSGSGIFASKLICGDCGGFYGQKVWHSNDPYRKTIWRCNSKFRKGQKCKTPSLTEGQIKSLFIEAYNIAMQDKQQKPFIAIAPDGTTFEDYNITRFAEEHNLTRKHISAVLHQRIKSTGGRKFYYKEIV